MFKRFAFSVLHTLSYLVWIVYPVFWLIVACLGIISAMLGSTDVQLTMYPTKSVHNELKDKILLWYLKSSS